MSPYFFYIIRIILLFNQLTYMGFDSVNSFFLFKFREYAMLLIKLFSALPYHFDEVEQM